MRTILSALILCAFIIPAQAKHPAPQYEMNNDGKYRYVSQAAKQSHYKHHRAVKRHRTARHERRGRITRYDAPVTFLPHPPGCPRRAFCGCATAVEIFGRPIRSLWLAANWFKFPRAEAAPGRVAVRRHHVFILQRHVEGHLWVVKDFNSGGHRSRLHVRSIAGYKIVNPRA